MIVITICPGSSASSGEEFVVTGPIHYLETGRLVVALITE
jgi:hypothetical protein